MVTIIDYGMGNLRSVAHAFQAIGCEVCVSPKVEDLQAADRLVLPGVGAFGEGMKKLRDRHLDEALREEVIGKGKPLLGICLGMQLLASLGLEHGEYQGLGFVPGTVTRLAPQDPQLRIPHIGWNDVTVVRAMGVYRHVAESPTFYFVHSYHLVPEDQAVVTGRCEYGTDFVASIQQGNIWGTQFHPEKSHRAGLAVLKNFATFQW